MSTYTKEFEEWSVQHVQDNNDAWVETGICEQQETAEAHFWLSAFVKLCREEASKLADEEDTIP